MSGPVIACLDEGPAGAATARVAGSLARRLCSRLVLATVTVAEAPGRVGGELGSSPVARGRSVLLGQGASILADAAVGVGPDPELRVELGEPAERLASLAQQTGARLLVLGVPDRCCAPGRALGNAYLALAGTAPCPVVVVPPSMEALQPAGRPILCGVDGSDESLAAARIAVGLGRRLDAPVQLVHVAERPRLSGSQLADGDYGARLVASHAAAMRVLLRAANIPQAALHLRVELGGAAERLADIAAREGAQLIVNGSSGRGARSGTLLGSVSSCLTLTASQPLVLVRAGGRATVVADGRNKTLSRPPRRARGVRRGSTGVRDVAISEANGPR
jgi:nucleotide-binding universal stress UspA family protein